MYVCIIQDIQICTMPFSQTNEWFDFYMCAWLAGMHYNGNICVFDSLICRIYISLYIYTYIYIYIYIYIHMYIYENIYI